MRWLLTHVFSPLLRLTLFKSGSARKEQNAMWSRILVQVTIYRRLLIGRDSHLDQSEVYDISLLVREYGPWTSKYRDCVKLNLYFDLHVKLHYYISDM